MTLSFNVGVGDVIRSEFFQYGDVGFHGRLTVGHCRHETAYDKNTSKQVRTGAIRHTGDNLDPDRANADYVVISAHADGGGSCGPGLPYPDGWHVIARRLKDNGEFDPEGQLIEFYQSGHFNCKIPTVDVVRKMQMVFV